MCDDGEKVNQHRKDWIRIALIRKQNFRIKRNN